MSVKLQKRLKKIMSVTWWIMVAVLVLLLVNVLGAKFRGEIPQIFGYSVMRIVSGSMEPEIPTGSYILVRRCCPLEVKKGDVISFYSQDPAIYSLPNTHRVVEDPFLEDGVLKFTTQGDANPTTDRVPASSDHFIGVYERTLGGLTDFSDALDGSLMFIILIGMQFGMAIIIVASLIKKNNDAESEKKSDESK